MELSGTSIITGCCQSELGRAASRPEGANVDKQQSIPALGTLCIMRFIMMKKHDPSFRLPRGAIRRSTITACNWLIGAVHRLAVLSVGGGSHISLLSPSRRNASLDASLPRGSFGVTIVVSLCLYIKPDISSNISRTSCANWGSR